MPKAKSATCKNVQIETDAVQNLPTINELSGKCRARSLRIYNATVLYESFKCTANANGVLIVAAMNARSD